MKITSALFSLFRRKSETSSWFGSIVIHLIILTIAIVLTTRAPKPGSVLGDRNAEAVGIVFSSDQGYETPREVLDDRNATTNRGSSRSVWDELRSESENSSRNEELFPLPTPRIGMNSGSIGTEDFAPESPGGPDRSGSTNGNGRGGQSVGFADVRGTGKKFVYVLDRSDSMQWNQERPMRYALREARASVQSLDSKQGALKFQLVYYNHEAATFQNARLLDVNESNKRKVAQFLQSLFPTGGTNPLKALELALALKPDVVFFLTDAEEEMSPGVLARIRDLREQNGVGQIHVVEFGRKNRSNSGSFRRLAEQNGGSYIFKDIEEIE